VVGIDHLPQGLLETECARKLVGKPISDLHLGRGNSLQHLSNFGLSQTQ
jgi:hypothetical protein